MNSLKAIILARGGSKSIPLKNIKKINGIPLLAYPIIAARKARNISSVYVSTDDPTIREVALDYGAKIIDRPPELAEDDSLDLDAFRHVVEHFGAYQDMVQLRATTPMVESCILDEAVEFFFNNSDCTSLRSAHELPETAYKFFKKKGSYWGGLFDHELEGEYYNLPRQDLPKTYHPNGYVDIVRGSHFMIHNSLHGDKILAFTTPFSHDVDTPEDLNILKALYDSH